MGILRGVTVTVIELEKGVRIKTMGGTEIGRRGIVSPEDLRERGVLILKTGMIETGRSAKIKIRMWTEKEVEIRKGKGIGQTE